MYLGLGGAVENLVLAARAQGRRAEVRWFPEPRRSKLVARAEPRWVPLVGAELGQARERLALALPGYRQQEDRWLWSPSRRSRRCSAASGSYPRGPGSRRSRCRFG